MMHLSECVPIIKQHMTVFALRSFQAHFHSHQGSLHWCESSEVCGISLVIAMPVSWESSWTLSGQKPWYCLGQSHQMTISPHWEAPIGINKLCVVSLLGAKSRRWAVRIPFTPLAWKLCYKNGCITAHPLPWALLELPLGFQCRAVEDNWMLPAL